MPETSEPPRSVRHAGPPAPLDAVLPAELLGIELLPTGHPRVDAGLAQLEALDGVPAEAHVAVYEDVHQRLVDTLAALDQE
ncbi:hypothetical protein [Kitasatospora sp. SC0581]|uniref:hypothetical protein n=1 Tax=Kitasatospora sp. SC0581 TaxID=3394360 RepID=UPI003A85433F